MSCLYVRTGCVRVAKCLLLYRKMRPTVTLTPQWGARTSGRHTTNLRPARAARPASWRVPRTARDPRGYPARARRGACRFRHASRRPPSCLPGRAQRPRGPCPWMRVANERADPLTLPGEPLHDLRSDGAGAAGYEDSHRPAPCCKYKSTEDNLGAGAGLKNGIVHASGRLPSRRLRALIDVIVAFFADEPHPG